MMKDDTFDMVEIPKKEYYSLQAKVLQLHSTNDILTVSIAMASTTA
jgi:hypothetical protein